MRIAQLVSKCNNSKTDFDWLSLVFSSKLEQDDFILMSLVDKKKKKTLLTVWDLRQVGDRRWQEVPVFLRCNLQPVDGA